MIGFIKPIFKNFYLFLKIVLTSKPQNSFLDSFSFFSIIFFWKLEIWISMFFWVYFSYWIAFVISLRNYFIASWFVPNLFSAVFSLFTFAYLRTNIQSATSKLSFISSVYQWTSFVFLWNLSSLLRTTFYLPINCEIFSVVRRVSTAFFSATIDRLVRHSAFSISI